MQTCDENRNRSLDCKRNQSDKCKFIWKERHLDLTIVFVCVFGISPAAPPPSFSDVGAGGPPPPPTSEGVCDLVHTLIKEEFCCINIMYRWGE